MWHNQEPVHREAEKKTKALQNAEKWTTKCTTTSKTKSNGRFPSFEPPQTNYFLFFFSDGVAAFRAFLKTEFSEENLEFWLACEEFKKTRSTAKLASKAQRIFEEFVDVQAPREVSRCEADVFWQKEYWKQFWGGGWGPSRLDWFSLRLQVMSGELMVFD